jgi:predicted PurR-regulated permease PerM
MQEPRPKLERTLGLASLVLLLGGCLLVIKPFVTALLWSVVLTFSLWPLHQRLVRLLGGRRALASALMAGGLALIVLLPFLVVPASIFTFSTSDTNSGVTQ